MGQPVVLLLLGSEGPSLAEQFVGRARQAAARDLLERALGLPQIGRVVIATNDTAWARSLADLVQHRGVVLDLDPPGEPFHFGQRLAGLIQKYNVDRALYLGGGSAPLMGPEVLAEIVAHLAAHNSTVLTNNLHSSDWAAFAPAGAVVDLADRLNRDNALAWVLVHEAGFTAEVAPRSAATQFDLDTPTDALIAALHPGAGTHLQAAAALSPLPPSPKPGERGHRLPSPAASGERPGARANLFTAARVLARSGSQVLVAGRVSASTWRDLETHTACWVRVFAEERGMAASGRLARGEVRSLVGAYLDLVGPQTFFQTLAGMAEAIFLDTRVLMAHRGRWPSAADRYASDLLWTDQVADPFWREFTAHAAGAPVPVVLGGHSLMAGGMRALLEAMEVGAL